MRNVYEFGHSELIKYINFVKVIWNSILDPTFQIWVDLVPRFKNTLILNILSGNDDLVPNFGLTIEVLSNFLKFGTKNKWNIIIDIHCLESG